MNEHGIMLADTITPDSYYVNAKGEKTGLYPAGSGRRKLEICEEKRILICSQSMDSRLHGWKVVLF